MRNVIIPYVEGSDEWRRDIPAKSNLKIFIYHPEAHEMTRDMQSPCVYYINEQTFDDEPPIGSNPILAFLPISWAGTERADFIRRMIQARISSDLVFFVRDPSIDS